MNKLYDVKTITRFEDDKMITETKLFLFNGLFKKIIMCNEVAISPIDINANDSVKSIELIVSLVDGVRFIFVDNTYVDIKLSELDSMKGKV